MSRRAWARLDNASNIFLAARSDVDPKVFRLSAEMDHDVDPELLQRALDETYAQYPLYRSALRRGLFWYYLQESDLHPVVEPETRYTCFPIYRADRRTLLFRVVYHRRRISLEVFHALSDGTGALWFLSDLLASYSRLRFPEEAPTEAVEPHGGGADPPTVLHELVGDSFAHYFRRRTRVERLLAEIADENREEPAETAPPSERSAPLGRVHRVRGTRTPDNRTRLVELSMPVDPVLALAKTEGVSLTMYLTALFFASIRAARPLGRRRTLAASVPINLRQFFPSTSARNFFATARIGYDYGSGDPGLGAVARSLDEQFRPRASRESLEEKLRKLIRFERMAVLRVVPRVLKDLLLGLINRGNNRGLTVALSNLGRVSLPGPAEAHVGRVYLHVSAVRPQFCAVSHAGILTLSFTSPFVEVDHVREFARLLAARGVGVRAAMARATEEELAGAPAEGDS